MKIQRFLPALLLLAGCQSADMEPPAPAVPALAEHASMAAEQWNVAWAAGDAAAIGSNYADDAIMYPPNSDAVVGRAAITEFWAGFLALTTNGSIESGEAANDGTIGYETGTYVVNDSTGAHMDHGKYVVVWRHGDQGWQIVRDIFNTSMPAPDASGM